MYGSCNLDDGTCDCFSGYYGEFVKILVLAAVVGTMESARKMEYVNVIQDLQE